MLEKMLGAHHMGLLHRLMVKAGLAQDGDHMHVVAISLFVTLLCACIVLGHLLEESRWMNESITALILGLCTGVIVLVTSKGASSHILTFNEELFFFYLLPPIIFNAGFQVKKKQFFANFVPIILYGVIGVFISFTIISAACSYAFPKLGLTNLQIKDYLALGTIFSATDSVCTLQVLSQEETPLLYSLVFGEGVVNDATSVVLFRAIQKFNFDDFTALTGLSIVASFLYLFFTSTVLGIATGLLSAYIIKSLYFGRHSTDREIAIMTLMAYLSYILAELFWLSGILTVFFCGIVMSHYTWHNVTESSRITTKHTFATLSFIAETFIFLYVGMDALDVKVWKTSATSIGESAGIFGTLLAATLLGRAAFVFPLSALTNFLRRSPTSKISFKQQIIIWWAGLMRGAVSIALAFQQFTVSGNTRNPEHATMITSTISVVLFSTVVFGILTKPIINYLIPPHMRIFASDSDPSSPKDGSLDDDLHTPLLSSRSFFCNGNGNEQRRSSLSLLLSAPTSTIHNLWRKFDNAYMRPIFGGRGFVQYIPGSPTRDEDMPSQPVLS